jgi:hypothetical protein
MNDKETWEFTFKDCEGNIFTFTFDTDKEAGYKWTEVLDKFIVFLERIYGYEIASKIIVE